MVGEERRGPIDRAGGVEVARRDLVRGLVEEGEVRGEGETPVQVEALEEQPDELTGEHDETDRPPCLGSVGESLGEGGSLYSGGWRRHGLGSSSRTAPAGGAGRALGECSR